MFGLRKNELGCPEIPGFITPDQAQEIKKDGKKSIQNLRAYVGLVNKPKDSTSPDSFVHNFSKRIRNIFN